MNQYELRQFANSQYVQEKTGFLNFWYKRIPARQRLWHLERNIFELQCCSICNFGMLRWNEKTSQYYHHCCSKCAHNDVEVKNKTKNTCIVNFGTTSNLNSPEHIEYTKGKCLELFGAENYFGSEQSKEENAIYWMNKCGYKTNLIDPAQIAANKLIIQEKYDREFSNQRHMSKEVIEMKNDPILMRYWYDELKMPVSEIAETLNIGVSQLCIHFRKNLGISLHRHRVSKAEFEIAEFIRSLNIEVESTNKTLVKPKEIDLYIPSNNLAIELNGIAWHCESRGKDKDYHLNKTDICKSKGVRLLHITDIEWRDEKEKVKSIIRAALGKQENILDAGDCKIIEISQDESNNFFEKNKFGKFKIGKINIGIKHNDILVAVLSITKNKITGICEKINYHILGGFEKLINEIKISELKITLDRRFDNEQDFISLGFVLDKIHSPQYMVTKTHKNLMKPSASWKKLKEMGYDRMFDCGYFVMKWRK